MVKIVSHERFSRTKRINISQTRHNNKLIIKIDTITIKKIKTKSIFYLVIQKMVILLCR